VKIFISVFLAIIAAVAVIRTREIYGMTVVWTALAVLLGRWHRLPHRFRHHHHCAE